MARKSQRVSVPIGIEKLLVNAAGDPAYRRRLLDDRAAVVEAARGELSASEQSILQSVSDEALIAMIDRFDLQTHTRRPFAQKVAAAVFATAALGAVVTAGTACTGIDPDLPDGVQGDASHLEIDLEDTQASRGAVPDEVLQVPDETETEDSAAE